MVNNMVESVGRLVAVVSFYSVWHSNSPHLVELVNTRQSLLRCQTTIVGHKACR
jgi:hypothetical protein